MQVTTTNKVCLYPINIPFELYIKWNTKRSAEGKGWWFTDSGKGRIGVDHVSWTTVGSVDDKQDAEIVKMMKKHKTAFLTDGSDFYTRMGPGLVKLTDTAFLYRMLQRWNAGPNGFGTWEAKKTYDETIDNLKAIK